MSLSVGHVFSYSFCVDDECADVAGNLGAQRFGSYYHLKSKWPRARFDSHRLREGCNSFDDLLAVLKEKVAFFERTRCVETRVPACTVKRSHRCLFCVSPVFANMPYEGYYSTWNEILVENLMRQGTKIEWRIGMFISIAPAAASSLSSQQTVRANLTAKTPLG